MELVQYVVPLWPQCPTVIELPILAPLQWLVGLDLEPVPDVAGRQVVALVDGVDFTDAQLVSVLLASPIELGDLNELELPPA